MRLLCRMCLVGNPLNFFATSPAAKKDNSRSRMLRALLPRTALLLALSSLLWPADAQAPQSALPPGTQQPGSVNGASAAPRTVRGRVQRRIGIGGAQATQNAPLATTPEPAYTGMGSLTNNQIVFDTWNGGNAIDRRR